MAIRIIITGGTIDKEYNQLNGKLVFGKTHIPQMLEEANCTVDLSIEEALLVDSLEMTDEDRTKIVELCKNSPEDQIVVTHGTDTMTHTARVLAQEITDKTIILTGAMVPYSFGGSDALFNLGSAITVVQCKEPGVYITMNGKIFEWDKVEKNREKGEFEEK